MGPKSRGYNKDLPKKLLRDYKLFAISCEGGKRERDYFKLCELISNRVKVDIIETDPEEIETKSSPEWVLARALEYENKYGLTEDDNLWLVIDIDRWEKKHIKELIKRCKEKKYWNIAISNPCFEVWLYLHKKKDFTTLNLKKSLKENVSLLYSGGYNCHTFFKNIKDAIINSEKLDLNKNDVFPKDYVTKVYVLFVELFKLVPVADFDFFITETLPVLKKDKVAKRKSN
ncbi:RloB family protein [Sphingobacterium siyangense]|uniref:RloB family protein n=1 Tax=Sphingobacterium siyangense TaxID=459529 RepID=UPI003DA2A855